MDTGFSPLEIITNANESWEEVQEGEADVERAEPGEAEPATPLAQPELPDVAQQAIEDFYQDMARQAERQRQQRQRWGTAGSAAKRNRERLYLEGPGRRAAEAASRAHLAWHPSWLSGPGRRGAETLRGLVAMQHFIGVDLEDAHLPQEERRSEDDFIREPEPLRDVCQQFLLDAPRGVYVLDGERWDFAAELEASGLSLEAAPAEVEEKKEVFSARLAARVRRCLGGARSGEEPPSALVRVATVALCQSGLASVERACAGPGRPRAVASGGRQDVDFELRRLAGAEDRPRGEAERDDPARRAWRIHLAVRRSGFQACLVLPSDDDADAEAAPDMLECSEGSRITRSASIDLEVDRDGALRVDVVDLCTETVLLNSRGVPYVLPVSGGQSAQPSQEVAAVDHTLPAQTLQVWAVSALQLAWRIPFNAAVGCSSGCGAVLSLARGFASYVTSRLLSKQALEDADGARRREVSGRAVPQTWASVEAGERCA